MTTFTLEPQYLFKLASMPRGFNTETAINHKCNVPFYTIVVDFLGNCLLCDCDGWLPIPVGKVLDFQSIDQVFSSDTAKILQQDILQQQFSWCAIDHCGVRNKDRIKYKTTLAINIDESCNLHCPSCRRDPIMLTKGPEYQKKVKSVQRIMQWLDNYNDPIHIIMSGNGDPLASHVMRHLLVNFKNKSTQTFKIMTNGLLIKKMLSKLPILNQITEFSISVDAGSQEVYEDVRRPAQWKLLLENLDFLKNTGKHAITNLNFALQNKNYKDLPAFVSLCEFYGMQGYVHQIDDWGTWSIIKPASPDLWTIKNGIYNEHNILDQSHPYHLDAKKIVQQNTDKPWMKYSPMISSTMDLDTDY